MNLSANRFSTKRGTNSSSPIPATQVEPLRNNALQAFQRITAAFLENNYEELAKSLADNGKPLLPVEKQNEAAISACVAKLKALSKDMEATKNLLKGIKAQGINYGDVQGETLPDGTVVVKILCLGSDDLKKKHLARHHNTRTTDAQHRLVIYMIQRNGQWYWNPFGW